MTFYSVRKPDDDFWEEMNNVDYKIMKFISNGLVKILIRNILIKTKLTNCW